MRIIPDIIQKGHSQLQRDKENCYIIMFEVKVSLGVSMCMSLHPLQQTMTTKSLCDHILGVIVNEEQHQLQSPISTSKESAPAKPHTNTLQNREWISL